MANLIYYQSQTPVIFAPSGDLAFTLTSLVAGAGRITALWDRGAGALPARYTWRIVSRWLATPAAGDSLRVYLITSEDGSAALTDGGLTIADADLASETLLQYNCQPLGAVVSNGADIPMSASGIVDIYSRYVGFAVWNSSTTKALTATASDHELYATPSPDIIQDSV